MPAPIQSLPPLADDLPSMPSIVLNASAVGATLGFCNGVATGAMAGIAGAVIGAVTASVAAIQPDADAEQSPPASLDENPPCGEGHAALQPLRPA